eukprot:m.4035 g.4035  ORF g.4035 m.4035 type:complete len:325 (-) comp2886_c0_seq1:2409-3383(-)
MASAQAEDFLKRLEASHKTLEKKAAHIRSLLALKKGFHGAPENHPMPPFVARNEWDSLAEALKENEQLTITHVPGKYWFAMRLDGNGFGVVIKRLVSLGVMEAGYSSTFAEIMQECAVVLLETFAGACCFTQSDEITLVVPPASVVRGQQQPHVHNGRVLKLCTLAAARVTAVFNLRIFEKCIKIGAQCPSPKELPTFDCRIGVYPSVKSVYSLILWRGQDCCTNSVSDAVHKADLPNKKKIKLACTTEKLKWLDEKGMLPLRDHQVLGSFYLRCKGPKTVFNPHTKMEETRIRWMTKKIEGHLLQLAADDKLPDLANREKVDL